MISLLCEHPMITEEVHHPAELSHGLAKHLEHVKPDAANVIRPLRKQMKAQTAHADVVPFAQHFGLDAGVGDGDAAQAPRKTRQCVKNNTIVVDMGVALDDETVAKAEMIKQRDESLDRCVGRRVAAARLIRKFVRRSENMRVRVPGAGRRFYPRSAWIWHRASNARRVLSSPSPMGRGLG
jgi:hypothetical protein